MKQQQQRSNLYLEISIYGLSSSPSFFQSHVLLHGHVLAGSLTARGGGRRKRIDSVAATRFMVVVAVSSLSGASRK